MTDLYHVSDTLHELRRDFLPHETGGVFLTALQVRQLTDGLLAARTGRALPGA